MQSNIGRVLPILCALTLGACDKMTETLHSGGPVTLYPATDLGPKFCSPLPQRRDQFALFQIAYNCAWSHAQLVALGAVELTDKDVQRTYRTMMREGMGLVRGNCADFFRKRGDSQEQVNLGRDVVAMGGTAAAAIIGLTGGSALALSIIAVSGAALYSGIDTYTKNFLFGVDNIESVRTLTMKTVDDNSAALLSTADTLSFQNVAGSIMDVQEMCKPASISAAVRIKLRGVDGGIQAAGENAGARNQLDAAKALTIGAWLGLPGGVVMDETRLAAACWATTPEGSTAENLAIIKKWLPGDPNGPYVNGPESPTRWPGTSARVASECLGLSSTMQNTIKKKIEELKAAAGTQKVVTLTSGGPAPAGVPSSSEIGPRYSPMRVP